MSWLVHIGRAGGREFQILGAATLKLRAPNEVQANMEKEREIRLVAVFLNHADCQTNVWDHGKCQTTSSRPSGKPQRRPDDQTSVACDAYEQLVAAIDPRPADSIHPAVG